MFAWIKNCTFEIETIFFLAEKDFRISMKKEKSFALTILLYSKVIGKSESKQSVLGERKGECPSL